MRKCIYFVLLFVIQSCSKPNTITWKLESGKGDVFISEGVLVTDFQEVSPGWKHTRNLRKTRYTIHGPGWVSIKVNNITVKTGYKYTEFTNP